MFEVMNNNPYAAPRSEVAVYAGVQPVRLFSAKGRIGRLRYLAYLTYAYVILGALGGVMGALTPVPLAFLVILVPHIVFIVLLTIQRSHDMDWAGWTAFIALIPLLGLIWLLNSGTRHGNRFGAPPPSNTLAVKIGGLLIPVVVGIGILAAIALPAYQQDTVLAKAAQIVKP